MPNEIYTLHTGRKVRLSPVPAFAVERIQALIKIPEPPVWHDEESGRDIVNPTDPNYITAVQDAETRRIAVSMLAAVVFGVDLVDDDGNVVEAPYPPEDNWEAKLAYLGIDWREKLVEDIPLPPNSSIEFARTACYLLYTQMDNSEIQYIAGRTLGGGEAYVTAVDTFPGDEARGKDRPVRAKRVK